MPRLNASQPLADATSGQDPRIRAVATRNAPWPLCATDVVREMSEVDGELRRHFRDLLSGRMPWPLYLWGGAGVGKTCAVLAMCDYVSAMYYDLGAFCDLIRSAEFGRHQNEAGYYLGPDMIYADWRRSRLCVLDEIGSSLKVSPHQYATLKRLVDGRHNKPAVYVSNVPLSELQRLYDDRIASRLAAGTVFELKGDDRRLQS